MEVTIDDVKQFIETNKDNEEVKKIIGGPVTTDKVKEFLEGDDGIKLIQPKLDSHFTNSLKTWKENNLNIIIEDEIKKRFPDEDPKDKKIRELEHNQQKFMSEIKRKDLQRSALSFATQKALPTELVDYFVGQDEETTNANLGKFEQAFNAAVKTAVEAKFKENGREIFINDDDFKVKNPWKKETFNLTEQGKMMKGNPELAKKLKAMANM